MPYEDGSLLSRVKPLWLSAELQARVAKMNALIEY
jgi:hypothetical protein